MTLLKTTARGNADPWEHSLLLQRTSWDLQLEAEAAAVIRAPPGSAAVAGTAINDNSIMIDRNRKLNVKARDCTRSLRRTGD